MIFFVILSTSCLAVFELEINEKGKIISYYDEYYVVQVNGTVTANNNFNSTLYNVVIPFNVGSLNIFEITNDDYVRPGQIEYQMFDPSETKTFTYEIRGVSPVNPMENNRSVLRSSILIEKASLQPMLISRLEKANVEKVDVNTSKVRGIKNRRLITVKLENPSEANYNISAVHVLKTPNQTLEEDNILDRWDFPKDKPYFIIGPSSQWLRDIVDYNVTGDEVYWLNTEINTKLGINLAGTHNISLFDQEDLLNPANTSLEKMEQLENVSDFLEHMMYVSKSYSKTHLNPGDIVDVEIRVSNFAPISRNITVEDFVPLGFSIVSNKTTKNKTLKWNDVVNPDSASRISYQLRYEDEDMLGVDYFEPAVVRYEDKEIHTNRIPFVRKYIPEKKVYVQKNIRASVNDEYVIGLTIQNVGKTTINDMYVKEFLSAADTFREITQAPEKKGLWLIPELKPNEEWEVKYVTNENEVLNSLPQVFGVKDNTVLKTLVFENFVKKQWIIGSIHSIEIIGSFFVVFAIGGVFFYSWYSRTNRSRSLRRLQKQIRNLRRDTTPDSSDSIDYLKAESSEGVQYPLEVEVEKQEPKTEPHPVSENENKKEAKENLDNLKKLHENLEEK